MKREESQVLIQKHVGNGHDYHDAVALTKSLSYSINNFKIVQKRLSSYENKINKLLEQNEKLKTKNQELKNELEAMKTNLNVPTVKISSKNIPRQIFTQDMSKNILRTCEKYAGRVRNLGELNKLYTKTDIMKEFIIGGKYIITVLQMLLQEKTLEEEVVDGIRKYKLVRK